MYFSWRWSVQERNSTNSAAVSNRRKIWIPERNFNYWWKWKTRTQMDWIAKWVFAPAKLLLCCWVFKKHYLRMSASWKSSPYFRCEATCKVEGCNCKVTITINEKSDRFGKSVFIGNVNHKTGALAFLQMKGEKISLEKQTY